jgi:hypothetical protein
LYAVIHIVDDAVIFGGSQILRAKGGCLPKYFREPRIEDAAIDRNIQPFVRIQNHRMGAFHAVQDVPHFGHHRGGSAIRGVYVQPDVVALGNVRNPRDRLNRAGGSRSNGRNNAARPFAEGDVFLDRAFE